MKSPVKEILTPEMVSRLSRLDLIARQVVEGFITGLHKSPYHGFSAEFAEHRQYMPGDSLRYLDWKVYGRSDRLYVKRFEEETNLKAHIILDTSASMSYQDKGVMTKMRYAGVIAASLAYLMLKQRDSVGLVTFADDVRSYLPPRSVQSQLNEILKTLDTAEPSGTTTPYELLHNLAERLSVRGLVIFISDCMFDPDKFVHAMKHFRHNGHEMLVFQVLDPRETAFDFTREARFVDMETGRRMSTQPPLVAGKYRELFGEYRKRLNRALHAIMVDYTLLTTDMPFDRALAGYLAKRKRLH